MMMVMMMMLKHFHTDCGVWFQVIGQAAQVHGSCAMPFKYATNAPVQSK
jgi:hypothetical protein